MCIYIYNVFIYLHIMYNLYILYLSCPWTSHINNINSSLSWDKYSDKFKFESQGKLSDFLNFSRMHFLSMEKNKLKQTVTVIAKPLMMPTNLYIPNGT